MQPEDAEEFMREALLEGRNARQKCHDNPPVGCVLVREGKIIARGYTNEPGKPHAEAMALSKIEESFDEIIAFVTLEPCSFIGRTGSCAREIVRRRIKEVYVGVVDPDPKNQGAGIQIIRDAGIKVSVGLLEDEIRLDLEPYLQKQC